MGDRDKLYSITKKEKGRLDIFFVNASVNETAPIENITAEQRDKIFHMNIKAVLFTVQKVLSILANDEPIILNGAVRSTKRYSDESVCSASKAIVQLFDGC